MRASKLFLPLVLSLFILPLTVRTRVASGADPPDAANFRIVLLDGSVVKGALSFVMNLDTQYGKIAITSSAMVSAKFDITDQWANIRTKDIQMRVKYKPATSDFKVTSSVGPLSIDLTQVAFIEPVNAQTAGAPTTAASPYDQGTPPVAPSDIYAAPPPTVPEAVPSYYAATPTYAYPVYVTPQPCAYPYSYPYVCWPGYGFIVVGGFGTHHHEHHERFVHHDGFDGRFHSAAAGRAFSSPSIRSTASPAFRSATPTFRSAAVPTVHHAAPTFRSAAPSVGGAGMQSGHTGGRFR